MNFSNIRQSIESIDYAWTKPQTYLVFVPGLSLLIQKIQFANILPLTKYVQLLPLPNNAEFPQPTPDEDAKTRHFINICKWHLRGSLVQIAASTIAIKTLALPIFSLLAIVAGFEMVDTFIKIVRNPATVYEFHPNGAVKTVISNPACNIF